MRCVKQMSLMRKKNRELQYRSEKNYPEGSNETYKVMEI